MKNISLTVLIFVLGFGFAQNKSIDSLEVALKSTKKDTNRVNVLNELAFLQSQNYPKTAGEYVNEALLLSKKLDYKKGEAFAEFTIGRLGWFKTEYDTAILHYQKALTICEYLNAEKNEKDVRFAKKLTGMIYNNTAAIYNIWARHPEALEYYLKGIKLSEEVADKKQASKTIGNLAILYYDLKDYKKAMEYFIKGLAKAKELGDKQLIGRTLGNIGNVYMAQSDSTKALEYFFKGLAISEEVGDKLHIAMSLEHIASIYHNQKNYSKALEYYLKGVKVIENLGNKNQMCSFLYDLGSLNVSVGNYKEAELQLNKALEISKEIGVKNVEKNSYSYLSFLYEKTNRQGLALSYYKKYIALRDTIFSNENSKKLMRAEIDHEYEKKKLLSDAEHQKEIEKQKAVADEKSRRHKVIIFSITVGLVLVLILALFIFRSNRQKQKDNIIISKQKMEVENQKELIEEKHKEITDSINYAERIQRSFIANEKLLRENLKDYFVLFQPKDIVSGDFYWASKLSNGYFAYVTADSTGHGVPGAIMSILNISSLEKSIETKNSPSEILNETRNIIIDRLKRDGSEDGGKDGMDATLVVLNKERTKLICALANNPVWILRNNDIIVINPDKMPVGKHDKDQIPFEQQEFDLKKGDIIYTLTDGMPDQFGGPNGKKYKYATLKEFLKSISSLPMNLQRDKLKEEFIRWKGNLEQIDDVTIVGVKV